ncbi:uncharacterized protein [Parasteatoda tepidariorum]|uniref:uncharacterized protein isoform X2 n=1 Tax=Parasteatoda tepidariorum TaxID=114398 RepID=UPI00077F81AE|nr:uncharacterized protein LOC107457347 isoform X2 [Parasteatoda tepidariorum]
MILRFRVHGVKTRMAMRLYHRRSSATREKIQMQNGLSPNSSLRLQVLGATCGHRDSLGVNRQRSQSLYPGSPNCLGIPTRSRSHSFSGPSKTPKLAEKQLTPSEEEQIFRCYTRVMYILLGGMAAVVMTLVLYGIRSFTNIT